MGKLEIQVRDSEQIVENIPTDGYLILYLDGDKVRSTGRFDTKVLMPIITKIVLEKMAK